MGQKCENACYKFLAVISVALLPSSCFNLHACFRLFCQTTISEMPLLIQKKIHLKIVVPKLQDTTLSSTRRDVQLEHCIVPNVPVSPQNHKMISMTILLKVKAPQNSSLLSRVNFAIRSFQDFALCISIETLNTECRSSRERKMLMWNK